MNKSDLIDFVKWYREDDMSGFSEEPLIDWYLRIKIQSEKQKELDLLSRELVKQMTGKEVYDTQDADYQIAFYYIDKAMKFAQKE